MTAPIRIGFALTGSFCTFARVMDVIQTLVRQGCEVTPILSFHAAQLDTRFGDAAMWRGKLFALTGRQPIDTIQAAEPIGPKACSTYWSWRPVRATRLPSSRTA